MLLCKRIEISDEKERISSEILSWSLGHERFLNVISLPYNSVEIFIKVILYYVNRGKKVAYVTNEDESCINILEAIRKNTDYRDYAYIRKPKINSNAKLKVCNYKNVISLDEKFDFIIYDEISSFPLYSKYEMLDLMSIISNNEAKFVVYSIENALKDKSELILPIKHNKIPAVEPRTIVTRVDIKKDIPFVVYDYLKWSIISDRKVIIYVPDEGRIEKVYSYIYNYCNEFSKNIIRFYRKKKDKKLLANFEKMKKAVLITDNFEQNFSSVRNTDVMVYFANDSQYDYKKLIYFCGNVGRSEKDSKGEVIFLANEETRDMEKAKNIMRNFNKEAWQMGLLRI